MASETSTSSTEAKLAALVVDNDPIARKIHTALLNKMGFEAHAVEDGKKAVDLFQSGTSFSLVLMDMEMPVMNGPEATKALRAMGVKSMIVGITSRDQDLEIQEFINAGLDSCHVKPMTLDKIKTITQEIYKH